MKWPDKLSLASLIIGALSLLAAIITGFFGAYIASIISLSCLLSTWFIWITLRILAIDRQLGREDKSKTAIIQKRSIDPYTPKSVF